MTSLRRPRTPRHIPYTISITKQSKHQKALFGNQNQSTSRWGILNYDMRQIKVNSLNWRVFRDDHIHYSSSPSTKIHGWCDQAFKASVSLKNLLHGNGRVVWHSLIENLDEYWIHAEVFKYSHSMHGPSGLASWEGKVEKVPR